MTKDSDRSPSPQSKRQHFAKIIIKKKRTTSLIKWFKFIKAHTVQEPDVQRKR